MQLPAYQFSINLDKPTQEENLTKMSEYKTFAGCRFYKHYKCTLSSLTLFSNILPIKSCSIVHSPISLHRSGNNSMVAFFKIYLNDTPIGSVLNMVFRMRYRSAVCEPVSYTSFALPLIIQFKFSYHVAGTGQSYENETFIKKSKRCF